CSGRPGGTRASERLMAPPGRGWPQPAPLRNFFQPAKPTDFGSWVFVCQACFESRRWKSIAESLHGLGVPWDRCWTTAACGKGWWRMAYTPAAQQGMDNAWFQAQGLVNPLERYLQLQH